MKSGRVESDGKMRKGTTACVIASTSDAPMLDDEQKEQWPSSSGRCRSESAAQGKQEGKQKPKCDEQQHSPGSSRKRQHKVWRQHSSSSVRRKRGAVAVKRSRSGIMRVEASKPSREEAQQQHWTSCRRTIWDKRHTKCPPHVTHSFELDGALIHNTCIKVRSSAAATLWIAQALERMSKWLVFDRAYHVHVYNGHLTIWLYRVERVWLNDMEKTWSISGGLTFGKTLCWISVVDWPERFLPQVRSQFGHRTSIYPPPMTASR